MSRRIWSLRAGKLIRSLAFLLIAVYGCRFAGPAAGTAPPASAVPSPQPSPPGSPAANPFGLMLGARGMSIEERVRLVRQMGATSFRPNSVFVQDWKGVCAECDAARQAGLELILTVRGNGGALQASTPPDDPDAYAQTLGMILDAVRPTVLVVENEENSGLFFSGTPEEYGAVLRTACDTAHARGIPCANGGLVSKLVALLVYDHYLEAGDTAGAQAFADRAFAADEQGELDSPRSQEQIQKGRALLQIYSISGADFINFHWYIADPTALAEAVRFLSLQTGLPAMTNELGQHDRSPDSVRDLMAAVVQLELPYAVWFSVDAPQAQSLIDPDGTPRDSGLAFEEFIRQRFDSAP